MEKIEGNVKFSLEELIVMSALVVAHRMVIAQSAAENHWSVIQGLHEKLVVALVGMTEKINKEKTEVEAKIKEIQDNTI